MEIYCFTVIWQGKTNYTTELNRKHYCQSKYVKCRPTAYIQERTMAHIKATGLVKLM